MKSIFNTPAGNTQECTLQRTLWHILPGLFLAFHSKVLNGLGSLKDGDLIKNDAMLHFSVLTTTFGSTVEGFHRAFCISSYFKSQVDFYCDVIFQLTLYILQNKMDCIAMVLFTIFTPLIAEIVQKKSCE